MLLFFDFVKIRVIRGQIAFEDTASGIISLQNKPLFQ
jgi:hypothetical protein